MSGITIPKNWRNLIAKTDITKIVPSKKDLLEAINKSLSHIITYHSDDQPILCLSGGVDSSIIAVICQKLNYSIHCLTISSNCEHPDIIHAKLLANKFNLSHTIQYLSLSSEKKDMYEILFNICDKLGYHSVICCDTIDEQLGGYWFHQKPQVYCEQKGIVSDYPKQTVFCNFWDKIIPDHLSIMQKWSKFYGIKVFLPYLTKDILLASRSFTLEERVNDIDRKIPLKKIAQKLNIPEEIIVRPKKGLVDALKIF